MSKVILTRYLYIFDEVGMSLIYSILKGSCLDECYFWLSELYLSGLYSESWQLLWFIYYDFYYILNPQFETFLHKKTQEGDLKSLMAVTKNLFKFKSSSHVFITRQYHLHCKEDSNKTFRGPKPKWLLSIPIKYHTLFRLLDKKLYHLASKMLPETVDDELFQSIHSYFKLTDEYIENIKKQFYNTNRCESTIVNGLNENILVHNDNSTKYEYQNHIHKIWAIICLLLFNPHHNTATKKIYIACSDDEVETLMKHHRESIPLNKYGNKQVYKTLEYKRLYSVNSLCSAFRLLRDNVDDINTCYRIHWEYYAYSCPLWNERFNQYNITIDDDLKKIVFNDDDELEDFYSQFGYDPDEQSYETENKRIVTMPENNWKKWYEDIFNESAIYEFAEDFRFSY